MDRQQMLRIAEEFLTAWNSQEVDRVLSCYTADLQYSDPNTHGPVRGADAMRRYLTKLFARWQMHWALREAHLFADGRGCAVLWHATLRAPGSQAAVGIDGIDFVELDGDRIARNEVCFDRALLSPLLADAA